MNKNWTQKYAEMMDGISLSRQEKDNMIEKLLSSTPDRTPDHASASSAVPKGKRSPKRLSQRILPAAAAACLVMGMIAAGATLILHLTDGMRDQYHVSDEDVIQILSSEPTLIEDTGRSVSDQGITVTAVQTIADNYFVQVALSIQGLDLQPGQEPALTFQDIQLDGQNVGNWDWAFYDISDTPIPRYVKPDGSIEVDLTLDPTVADFKPGAFLGKEIRLSIHEIGIGDEAPGAVITEGNWDLHWTLNGSETIRVSHPQSQIPESSAAIKEVRLSPISMEVLYDFPKTLHTEQGVDQDGQPFSFTTYDAPPLPNGLRLKDGSVITSIMNGGYDGYPAGDAGTYQVVYHLATIIDPAQVESILLRKEGAIGSLMETAPDLSDYIEIPLPDDPASTE